MKRAFYLLVFMVQLGFGQESEFTFDNQRGMTDYLVVAIDNQTANEIYSQVIAWIKVAYNNPDKVIISTIDNEYVRLEGTSSNLWCLTSLGVQMCYDTKYQIEITVKDGTYKFDLIGIDYYTSPSVHNSGGWQNLGILFNRNSTPEQLAGVYKKDGTLRGVFKQVSDIPRYFNKLNASLLKYIKAGGLVEVDW